MRLLLLFTSLFCLFYANGLAQAVLVKDINPGAGDGVTPYQQNFFGFKGKLYFAANDGVNGEELWVSDGGAAATYMLKDIHPGVTGSNPRYFTEFNGKLYFAASDSEHGLEVWETEGTPNSTKLYHEFVAGTSGSGVSFIGVSNGKLFIRASNGSQSKLWATNGPDTDLTALADAAPGFSAPYIAAGASKVYFVDGNDALWVSDGSPQGTLKLKNSPLSFAYYSHMTVIGEKLYYGFGGGSYGTEPWVSNGTPSGTVELKEMIAGEFDGGSPTYFIEYKGYVYFRALNQLWRTDGTPAGTQLFRNDFEPFGNINFDNRQGIVFKDRLYFAGVPSFSSNSELWSTDGTGAGTAIFKELNSGFLGSDPSLLIDGRDGNFYFCAALNTSDYALWKSDGTPTGTLKIADPYPGDNAENLWAVIPVGNTLFYAAKSAANGLELWKYAISTETAEPRPEPQMAVLQPNPATDRLFIASEKSIESALVADVTGNEMLRSACSGTQNWLDINSLPQGVYFLILRSDGKTWAGRFIKG